MRGTLSRMTEKGKSCTVRPWSEAGLAGRALAGAVLLAGASLAAGSPSAPEAILAGSLIESVDSPDLAPVLASLDAADAGERARAERWLVEHLGPGDLDALRAGLRTEERTAALGPEARWRLARALGSREANLALILDLVTGNGLQGSATDTSLELELAPSSSSPNLRTIERELGRRALEHLLATWRSGLDRQPLSGAALAPLLEAERERHAWQPLSIQAGPVADNLAELIREADLPVPVVLSQDLASKLSSQRFGTAPGDAPRDPHTGPWDVVLLEIARTHDLAFEAVMHRGPEGVDEFAWLRLVARDDAGEEAGSAQVVRAFEDVARAASAAGADAAGGRASLSTAELQLAARFLAGIGWSGSLGYLGDLWAKDGNALARTALLEGAARGYVEPRLANRQGVTELLRWAGELAVDPGGDGHLMRLEDGLRALPRWGRDGADLATVLFDVEHPTWPATIEAERLRAGRGLPTSRGEAQAAGAAQAWATLARVRLEAAAAWGSLPPAGIDLAREALERDTGEGLDRTQLAALRALRAVARARTPLDAGLGATRGASNRASASEVGNEATPGTDGSASATTDGTANDALPPEPSIAELWGGPLPELRWERVYDWVPTLIRPDDLAVLLAACELAPPAPGGTPREWRLREVRLAVLTLLLHGDRPLEPSTSTGLRAALEANGLLAEDAPVTGPLAAALLVGAPLRLGGLELLEPDGWRRLMGSEDVRARFDGVAKAMRTALDGGHHHAVLEFLEALNGIAYWQAADLDNASLAGTAEPSLALRLALITGLATTDPALLDRRALRDPGSPEARLGRVDFPFLIDLEDREGGSYLADDLEALAWLTGSGVQRAEVAKQRLLQHYREALQAPLLDRDVLRALELAVHTHWRRGADAEADALIFELAMLAAAESDHPLARRILFQPWPPPIR